VSESRYERILDLCKRRGFFFQSAEIYGGVAGFIDYGPAGARIKANIINLWREMFIDSFPDLIYEVETPVITPEQIFKASGHVDHFTDPIVRCPSCMRFFRADHVLEEQGIPAGNITEAELMSYYDKGVKCPSCGATLGKPERFNLLFKTTIGPYEATTGYIRAETAQGIFTLYKRAYEVLREKKVFGLAQIGRVGRNEISPRQGPLRLREFTQMEIEFFFDPINISCVAQFENLLAEHLTLLTEGSQKVVHETVQEAVNSGTVSNLYMGCLMALGQRFLVQLGIPEENFFYLEVPKKNLPHYSRQTWDLMVKVDRWGWVEVAGYSYRGDFDLKSHAQHSGEDLSAYRAYDRPVMKEKVNVTWDPKVLRGKYGTRTGEIIDALKLLKPDEVLEGMRNGFVVAAGQKISISDLTIKAEVEKEYGERFVPHVTEPSFGVDRILYALIDTGFMEREGRIVLRVPRRVAYPQVGVLPLVKRDGLDALAKKKVEEIRRYGFTVTYDEDGAIGRRYARLDEIGVPVAVTVDYDTLRDGSITLRDRDTWNQVRVKGEDLEDALCRFLRLNAQLSELGTPFTSQGENT